MHFAIVRHLLLPHKYPQIFTKIDQFIKVQLGNHTPECKDLLKTKPFIIFAVLRRSV